MSTAVSAGNAVLVHTHAQLLSVHNFFFLLLRCCCLVLLFLFGVLWPLTNNLLVTYPHLLDWSNGVFIFYCKISITGVLNANYMLIFFSIV